MHAARPLHGAGIGQMVTLARYNSLEQVPIESARRARQHHGRTKPPTQATWPMHLIAKVVDQLEPQGHAGQAHFQARVALVQGQQVAREAALQLFPRHAVDRALRDGDNNAGCVPSRRQRH